MSHPWMPLYIADYRADTAHLSAAEHGAYLLLIMHYWTTGGLPGDDRQLSRIACMTPGEWRKAKPTIQKFFHDGWQHKRIDAELKQTAEVSASYAARAAKAAKARWDKQSLDDAPSMQQALHEECLEVPSSQPQRKKDAANAAPAEPSSPEADLFRRGKELLGSEAGGLIKRLVKAKGGSIPLARAALEMAATKHDKREYIGAIIRGPEKETQHWTSAIL